MWVVKGRGQAPPLHAIKYSIANCAIQYSKPANVTIQYSNQPNVGATLAVALGQPIANLNLKGYDDTINIQNTHVGATLAVALGQQSQI
jgi:hypothetical protein